jgi:hypothetical protein
LKDAAVAAFESAANDVATGMPIDQEWVARVERLSTLCVAANAFTHIAFLGTSILAKAASPSIDLTALKPVHAGGNVDAYSARTLSEKVLVPLAAKHMVHIGVTGRQPLNNQPYFRMTSLGDGTPVRGKALPAFEYILALVAELQKARGTAMAKRALRAFIAVRQRHWPRYDVASGRVSVSAEMLAQRIEELVRKNSENGARAQAVAAGLLDVFVGDGRVESGRVNDPSRHYPGDVCILSDGDDEVVHWEKSFEVRDKPVSASDVTVFCAKCAHTGVREASVLMVSQNQAPLDDLDLMRQAARTGVGLTLFYGWDQFVSQVLFWAPTPKIMGVIEAVDRIEARLVSVEASPEAVGLWHSLTRSNED